MDEPNSCFKCKYAQTPAHSAPCNHCHAGNEWKPMEEKMNETVRPNYEGELKRTREELEKVREELEVACAKISDLEDKACVRNIDLATKRGEIEGLRFAIRCNGVSGGEV